MQTTRYADTLTVKIVVNDHGNLAGKLADAELHFGGESIALLAGQRPFDQDLKADRPACVGRAAEQYASQLSHCSRLLSARHSPSHSQWSWTLNEYTESRGEN
jgi:hypothetical protein